MPEDPSPPKILMESGDAILMEDGTSAILMEGEQPVTVGGKPKRWVPNYYQRRRRMQGRN